MFNLTQKNTGDVKKVAEQVEVQSKITWTVIPTSWYGTGWSHAAGYAYPAYAQDAFGFIHFRGIFNSSSGASMTFLTVPDSLSPFATEGFANYNGGFIQVQSNGQFVTSSATTNISLSGVNYTTF